jgi:hypothetical protein
MQFDRRDADAEDGLGDILSEISKPTVAQPLQAAEAPGRKRKAVASHLQVHYSLH